MTYQTTTELMEAAKSLAEEAKTITTRKEHANLWDRKVEVLEQVNKALEAGYYVGAAYDELKAAQHYLWLAENLAGKAALQTYAR